MCVCVWGGIKISVQSAVRLNKVGYEASGLFKEVKLKAFNNNLINSLMGCFV